MMTFLAFLDRTVPLLWRATWQPGSPPHCPGPSCSASSVPGDISTKRSP